MRSRISGRLLKQAFASNLPQEKGQPSSVDLLVFRLVSFVSRLPFFSGSGSVFLRGLKTHGFQRIGRF
jgi:hypothetical protein